MLSRGWEDAGAGLTKYIDMANRCRAWRHGCDDRDSKLCYSKNINSNVLVMPVTGKNSESITELLIQWQQGDDSALDRLSPLIYQELHRLASRAMRREGVGHTLQTTALVNEAFMHLMGSTPSFKNRIHFYKIAARQMRHILVDHARTRCRKKRGQGVKPLPLIENQISQKDNSWVLLELDDALSALGRFDQRKQDIIELHFFAGLTIDETAEFLGISSKTVQRELRLAEAWLQQSIEPRNHET